MPWKTGILDNETNYKEFFHSQKYYHWLLLMYVLFNTKGITGRAAS